MPSTAPYESALALTGGDVGDLQRAIDAAPTRGDLALLDSAAAEIEQAHRVVLRGRCPHCGKRVVLRDFVTIQALAGVAEQLRGLRERLARFDVTVLRRLVARLGEGASLWFTGKG